MITNDLAWAAGFIDGEGSIGIYWAGNPATRSAAQLRLSVEQVGVIALRKLQSIFGGNVRLVSRTPRPGCRPTWRWSITGGMAADALSSLYEFLTEKKSQAEVALEFRGAQEARGHLPKGRHSLGKYEPWQFYVDELKRLKREGAVR